MPKYDAQKRVEEVISPKLFPLLQKGTPDPDYKTALDYLDDLLARGRSFLEVTAADDTLDPDDRRATLIIGKFCLKMGIESIASFIEDADEESVKFLADYQSHDPQYVARQIEREMAARDRLNQAVDGIKKHLTEAIFSDTNG